MKNKEAWNIKKFSKKMWIPILLCLLTLGIMSYAYIKTMDQLTHQNIYNNIAELSEQTADQLTLQIKNQMQFVELVVDFINGGYVNSIEEIFKRFESDLETYHFTRLVILDEKGNGKTSEGITVENYPNIAEFFQTTQVSLSENRPSTVSNNQVNIYSKTFQLKGQKMVLFATVNTEDYQSILSRKLFNGQSGTFLVNHNGEILLSSTNTNQNNIYELLKEKSTEKDFTKIIEMQESVTQKQTGTFNIDLDKEENFIHYENLNLNDWYVITTTKKSVIAKELTKFMTFSLLACFIVNIILMLVFISMYLSHKKKNKKLYELAYLDNVTNLGNELYLKENGTKLLSNKNTHLYITVIDINKFKHYSKIYDYEFCNQILTEFGNLIQRSFPKNNITCRISRDVFVSMFYYNQDIKKLMKEFFEKVEFFKVFKMPIHLNTSVGIYKLTKKDNDINKSLDKAYTAHNKAKGPYSNNYFIFDEELESKVLEEQKIEFEMESSLEKSEFKVVYQPKVYVKTGYLAGAEALVRWHHENTIIPPNKFIPLFEKNQFIIKLDLFVFEEVCKNMKEWLEQYGYTPIISVNVSASHFQDENFIDEYVKITDKYKIDRSLLDLEITESTTVDETIDIIKIIDKIKEKGFMISLDDFGTGYSSLSMLQQLDIDIIKIDKTFIEQANLKSDKNIINYISLMSKKLGVKTIVEGIETKNQVEFIQKLKCDMIQGYYYSKPISKKDFEEYFETNRKK